MIWIKGLLAAALAGAASTAGVMVIDPDHFNVQAWRHLGLVASVGAVTGVIGYLKQSPVPAFAPAEVVTDQKRAELSEKV